MASPLLRILLAAVALVVACAAPAAAQAPVGSSPDPDAIADRMAASWVALQRPSGSFPDSIRQQRGWGRYGEAGLGYGLMLSGLRAGRPDWIQAGARAQRFAIAQALDRNSVFENMLIASGYNLLRLRAPDTPLFTTDRCSTRASRSRTCPRTSTWSRRCSGSSSTTRSSPPPPAGGR
jgi:hypothetical protein